MRHVDASESGEFCKFSIKRVRPFDTLSPAQIEADVSAVFALAKSVTFIQLFDVQGAIEDWLGCEVGHDDKGTHVPGWANVDDRPQLQDKLGLTLLHAFDYYR